MSAKLTGTRDVLMVGFVQGGLKNKKFMSEYPDFCFSTVDDYVSYKSIMLEDMNEEE